MNKELLSLLVPKTQSLEKTTGSNDSITPEDINMVLSYSSLTKEEYNFLLMKFVSADTYRNAFVSEIALRHMDKESKVLEHSFLNKLINLAVIEACEPKCIFCNGVGTITTINSISKCPHCTDGVFNFTDEIRNNLLNIDNFSKYKKMHDNLTTIIQDIEMSALSKIGDT
tara:strand:- start:135 stop:644 length:510 start_codon:yes stop_codon:yes gene_type:complete